MPTIDRQARAAVLAEVRRIADQHLDNDHLPTYQEILSTAPELPGCSRQRFAGMVVNQIRKDLWVEQACNDLGL